MGRLIAIVALLAAVGGCYNPRYPSESPAAASTPDPESSHVIRDRRNEAAGAGASSR